MCSIEQIMMERDGIEESESQRDWREFCEYLEGREMDGEDEEE